MEKDRDTQQPAGLPDFLVDPVGMLLRRWRWMLAALLAGFVGTAAYVASTPLQYAASATLLVSGQQIPKDFVQTTIQEDPLGQVDAMIGAVLTRGVLSRLMDEYNLYPTERDTVARDDLIAKMRASVGIWEKASTGVKRRNEGSRLFSISFTADEPEIAAKIANEIGGELVEESIRVRTQLAGLTTQFLRRELEKAESALREQNRLITEFKEFHRGELPAELVTNLSTLDRLQQQRQSLALQIAEAETRAALSSRVSPTSRPEDLSPAEQLRSLQAALTQSVAVNTESHPDVIALRLRIARLESQVPKTPEGQLETSPSGNSFVSGSEGTLIEYKAQLAATETRIEALDARVARTPSRQEKLAALEESEMVLREMYLGFLRKVQDAELAESLESAQQGGRVSVIDAAHPPTDPTRSRLKLVAAGVAASFVFSFGVGARLEVRDPVVTTAAQLELAAGIPVLGSTPRIS